MLRNEDRTNKDPAPHKTRDNQEEMTSLYTIFIPADKLAAAISKHLIPPFLGRLNRGDTGALQYLEESKLD